MTTLPDDMPDEAVDKYREMKEIADERLPDPTYASVTLWDDGTFKVSIQHNDGDPPADDAEEHVGQTYGFRQELRYRSEEDELLYIEREHEWNRYRTKEPIEDGE